MPLTLDSLMSDMRSKINTEDAPTEVSRLELEEVKGNTVVVMPAGGKGLRIRNETQNEDINKVMICVDGKESMIERTVREYSACGIDNFVVLTGFLSKSLERHLGDGSRWGVDIRYSEDPHGRKVGNAGAILNALNNGVLDDGVTAIIHNPDDMIIGMKRPYGEVFLEGQIRAKRRGCIATFVVVPETPYQYSGMIVDKGVVRDVRKYPLIAVPAHTGITVFGPEIYEYFRRLVSLEVESSFENVVAPEVAKAGKLYAINIPTECWVPVNDLKGIEKARAALSLCA